MKKRTMGLGAAAVAAGLIAFALRAFGDPMGGTPTGKAETTEGAWYDEAWEAAGFYRLQRIGGSNNFRYEFTASPTTGAIPTFAKGDSPRDRNTEQGGTDPHDHEYEDATSQASLPQDLVVTEWRVSGHVHFDTGL